jgi:lysophospholipase L1-like esterase
MFRTRGLPETTSLSPDYITVAYGTNDWSWSGKTLDEITENANAYFTKLTSLYPSAEIFYISPLYRGDEGRITTLGDFFGAVERFSEVAKKFGCKVINGRDLIPHSSLMFDDKYLHPNDLGFTQYAKALEKELRKLGVC